MNPGHILTQRVGGNHMGNNLIEVQRRGVDDCRVVRRMSQNFRWHQGASIQTDRRGGDQVTATQGDEVRGAGSGADKEYSHDPVLRCGAGR